MQQKKFVYSGMPEFYAMVPENSEAYKEFSKSSNNLESFLGAKPKDVSTRL